MAFGLANIFRLDQLDDVRALNLVSGDVLVWDADEDEFTAVNSSTFGGSNPPFDISDITGLQTALDNKQPIDSDLTAIAGLSASNDDLLQKKSGNWTNRTPSQVKTDLALTKGDVGLGNVDNVSDADKPVSTATQAALDLKAPIANPTFTGTVTLAADPASALQAATKQYVDGLAINVGKRARVRAATTASITISTALNNGDSLDGVTLVTGDLVLVKNQSAPEENGVYVVGPSPTRSSEFDAYNEHPGSLIAVEEGTANVDTLWLCTSNGEGTLNSTAIAFAKMVVAGELLAANNLSDLADTSTARNNLGVAIGTHVQAYDADLAAIAGLTPSDDDIIQRKSGSWTNRTVAQFKSDLSLTKADVGLANADNTSDANKPISTATQTALDAKASLASVQSIFRTGGPHSSVLSVAQTYVAGVATSSGFGDITLHTVSANSLAFVLWLTALNNNGSSRDVTPFWTRSGTSRDLAQNPSTIGSGSFQNLALDYWPIFRAGDAIQVAVTGNQVDVGYQIHEFSDDVPIVDVVTSDIQTSGTLYTCPIGKSAILLPADGQFPGRGSITVRNATGGSITVTIYRVPAGESIAAKHKIKSQSINNGSISQIPDCVIFLNAGDFIAYEATDDGPGFVGLAVLEFGS